MNILKQLVLLIVQMCQMDILVVIYNKTIERQKKKRKNTE
jgi:hypothetical protein